MTIHVTWQGLLGYFGGLACGAVIFTRREMNEKPKIDRFLDWCAMACAHYPIVWLMMLPILVPIVSYQLVRNLINYYRRSDG